MVCLDAPVENREIHARLLAPGAAVLILDSSFVGRPFEMGVAADGDVAIEFLGKLPSLALDFLRAAEKSLAAMLGPAAQAKRFVDFM